MFYKSWALVGFMSLYAALNLVGQDSAATVIDTTHETIEDVSFVEFDFDFLLTSGSFGTTIDRNLAGFTFSYLNQASSKTYSFFGFQLSRYGVGRRSGVVNSNGFEFSDNTATVFYTLQALYRVYSPFFYKNIEPFVEAALGPQFIYTGTSTTFFDELSTTEYNFEETNFGISYGLSIGLNCKIYDRYSLLLKAGYFSSNAVDFLVPRDDLNFELPVDNFDLRNTQLTYLKLQLGLAYSF